MIKKIITYATIYIAPNMIYIYHNAMQAANAPINLEENWDSAASVYAMAGAAAHLNGKARSHLMQKYMNLLISVRVLENDKKLFEPARWLPHPDNDKDRSLNN